MKVAADFGVADLGTLMNAVKSPRLALLLSPGHFAKLITGPVPAGWTIPGFAGGVYEADFSAAGPNVVGCVCDPTAIAVVATTPKQFPFPPIETVNGTLPGLDLPFATFIVGSGRHQVAMGELRYYLGF